MEKLTDEMLEGVSGGTEIRYDLENDPLYNKLKKTAQDQEKENGTGMESRTDFLTSFKDWVSGGAQANKNVTRL